MAKTTQNDGTGAPVILPIALLERRAKHTEAMRRWRAKNPERSRATLNAWRRANPEKRRAQEARYRKTHREAYLAKQKRSIAKIKATKPELIRKWRRNWYQKNKTTEHHKAQKRKHRKAYVMRHAAQVSEAKDRNSRNARLKITPGYARQTLTAKSNLLACQLPEPLVQAQIANLKLKRHLWQNRKT
jgi:hypothetical protein